MAMLYAVVLVGYVAILLVGLSASRWAVREGMAGVVGQLMAGILLLAGTVAVLAGLIAFVYKVIADANSVAQG